MTSHIAAHPYEKERSRFRSLILTNPNYFGNIAESEFEPVLQIAGDTFYEEIGCVGFEPALSLLEAVVYVKQFSGYAGGVCSGGSKEYVRFYLSFDDGATWNDQGEVSFTVYDVPGDLRRNERLEFACTRKIDPLRKYCSRRNILRARAILSWNAPNPPNAPHHVPVWGNVHDTWIQIAKRDIIIFDEVLEQAGVTLPAELTDQVDVKSQLNALPPKPKNAIELAAIYKDQPVEPHRFAFAEALAYLEKPELTANIMSPGFTLPFGSIDVDPAGIFEPILVPDGDTRYEQLECIGYYPGAQEALVGVVRVKLPAGYSGNPCSAGSFEHVTFWADFDHSGNFVCLGQTAINVHDFNPMPKGGLEYAVYLPVNLDAHRQDCTKGAKVVRIRAILSWAMPAPCANPGYIPVWGNRLDTLVQLQPGVPATPHVPLLSRAGDMSYIDINASGLANGATLETGFAGHDSPFGGRINFAGKIPSAGPGMKYRIVKKLNGAPDSSYAPIVNEPQGIKLDISINSGAGWATTSAVKHALAPISDGYYEYEDYSSTHFVEANLMGFWETAAGDDGGLFDVRVDVSVDGNPAHDLHSNVVTLRIDNTRPGALVNLNLGGQCGDFQPGDHIAGTFTATDAHFGGFSFVIEPSGPPNFPSHGVLPVPASGRSVLYGGTIADPGLAGAAFTIDTTGMDPCGYALILRVNDRTNVNNGQDNNRTDASAGFCLRTPA
jgi:hypothetical protein